MSSVTLESNEIGGADVEMSFERDADGGVLVVTVEDAESGSTIGEWLAHNPDAIIDALRHAMSK